MRLKSSPEHELDLIRTSKGIKLLQEVQYITCDHNCVVNIGFTSDKVKSVCKAVRKDVRSAVDGDGCDSANMEERGVAGPRLRAKLCLSDENPLDVDVGIVPWLWDDESDGPGLGGEDGALARDRALPEEAELTTRFLLVKDRRNDQSDSN